jgi:hypothetical protein
MSDQRSETVYYYNKQSHGRVYSGGIRGNFEAFTASITLSGRT